MKVYTVRMNGLKVKDFAIMEAWEECRKKLNTLSSRIQYAAYGESSFFSGMQIKDNELEEIHSKDLQLMVPVKALSEKIETMTIEEIHATIAAVEASLEERSNYIKLIFGMPKIIIRNYCNRHSG